MGASSGWVGGCVCGWCVVGGSAGGGSGSGIRSSQAKLACEQSLYALRQWPLVVGMVAVIPPYLSRNAMLGGWQWVGGRVVGGCYRFV